MQKIHKVLTKLHNKYGGKVVSKELLQRLDRTSDMLDQKEICISVFGQHNCGKSTLLNALIGDE